MGAAADDHTTARPPVEPLIEKSGSLSEVGFKARHLPIQGAEDEASITLDTDFAQTKLRLVELRTVAIFDRNAREAAGIFKRPVVIWTGKPPRISFVLTANRCAAMGAAIEESVHPPFRSRVTMTGRRPSFFRTKSLGAGSSLSYARKVQVPPKILFISASKMEVSVYSVRWTR
jgi:hypothetical protein